MTRPVDIALYVVIALALVLGVVLWAWLLPNTGLDPKWWMFAWFTAGLSFLVVQSYWPARQLKALWGLLALALMLHTAAHAVLFRQVQHWPGIAYLFTMPAEAMAVTYLVWKVLKVLPREISLGRQRSKRG